MMEKVDISSRYVASEEVRESTAPYDDYYDCLYHTFREEIDSGHITSVADVGCATGHLLSKYKSCHPTHRIEGFEYFAYHKESPFCTIPESITTFDIRDPYDASRSFDLVNCTECGEHIDKAFEDRLIENLKLMSTRWIILTWSSTGGENDRQNDPNHQHLNPLSTSEFLALATKHGLRVDPEKTRRFLEFSKKKKHFYPWWRASFHIFTK